MPRTKKINQEENPEESDTILIENPTQPSTDAPSTEPVEVQADTQVPKPKLTKHKSFVESNRRKIVEQLSTEMREIFRDEFVKAYETKAEMKRRMKEEEEKKRKEREEVELYEKFKAMMAIKEKDNENVVEVIKTTKKPKKQKKVIVEESESEVEEEVVVPVKTKTTKPKKVETPPRMVPTSYENIW